MNKIDSILNEFTMYKIVLFGLLLLTLLSLIYSALGIIFYDPISLLSTLIILVVFSFISNFLIAKILKVTPNTESSVITALILFFIILPVSEISEIWIYIFASVLAIASKYILVKNKKHIFNPAAFSIVILGLLGLPVIGWWIGNSDLFIFVLIIGLLVVRKVRKLMLFSAYFVFALFSISIFAQLNGREVSAVIFEAIRSYPLLFLGFFMLIEPLTMPSIRKNQLIYAGLIGLLSGAQYQIGPIYSSPELALLLGNIYAFFVSKHKRFELSFIDKKEIAPNIFEFIFKKPIGFSFEPGQYAELTLGGFRPDMRGVRRFFTVASSPKEDMVKFGIRINKNGSKFKIRLMELTKDEKVYMDNIAGDFILPKDKSKKLVFIAGGIGVTPFRSMIKSFIDKKEKRDIVLFYLSSSEKDFVYKDIFESAKEMGLKTIYITSKSTSSWKGLTGRLDKKISTEEVSDYKNRIYYLSGPNIFVDNYKKLLRELGIKRNKIVIDYFSGY